MAPDGHLTCRLDREPRRCHNLAGADPGRSWLERGQSRVGLVSYAYHSFMSGCPVPGVRPLGRRLLSACKPPRMAVMYYSIGIRAGTLR